MNNKKHHIIDDAWDMPQEMLGEAVHTVRVGLVVNTVIKSKPVVIDDLHKLIKPNDTLDFNKVKNLPSTLLNFKSGSNHLAMLLVYNKESGNIECYPFSDVQDGKHWWLYEVAFDLATDGRIEIKPIHDLLEKFDVDPTKGMVEHLESLAAIATSFLRRLCDGDIELEEDTSNDYVKLNKKRVKKKLTPIENSWNIKYVSEQNS